MPKFLEDKLRAEAAAKGKTGRQADRYVYGTMNAMGAMLGNQETAKGAQMEATHEKAAGHPHKNLGAFLHPKKAAAPPKAKRGSLASHASRYGR